MKVILPDLGQKSEKISAIPAILASFLGVMTITTALIYYNFNCYYSYSYRLLAGQLN